jgi:hypothetical protein
MSKGASSKAALVLMLIGVCGVGALAWYVKAEPKAAQVPADLRRSEPPTPEVRISRRSPSEETQETAPSHTEKTVMVPVFADDKVAMDMQQTTVPEGKDPKAFLVEEVAKGSHVEAKILGVDVHNGVAVINFGNGIDDGMSSDQEALFISALQKAFSQFDDVQKLELDKESQPLESLGGHIDLTDGLPVLRPGSAPSDSKPSEP